MSQAPIHDGVTMNDYTLALAQRDVALDALRRLLRAFSNFEREYVGGEQIRAIREAMAVCAEAERSDQ